MVEELITKAITDIESKLIKHFDQERLNLQSEQTTLESRIHELETRLKKAEESRSQLLAANSNLENKLGIAMSANDDKVRKVMQRAYEDNDFYNKIVEAAQLYTDDCEDADVNVGTVRLTAKEVASMKTRINELLEKDMSNLNFIDSLRNEVRLLRLTIEENEKLQSEIGIDIKQSSTVPADVVKSQKDVEVEALVLNKSLNLTAATYYARAGVVRVS